MTDKSQTAEADIAYDLHDGEILVTLPPGHLVHIKPEKMVRVIIPGIGTFNKTEEWHAATCPTCGHPADCSMEPHLTAALITALRHVPPEIKEKIERYLERVLDAKLIAMAGDFDG